MNTPLQSGIAIAIAICLAVIGLSHVLRPRDWADLFILIRRQGEPGAIICALMHLPPAALIVGFHNVWSGIPTVLTVLGYAWMLKATLYLTFPQLGLKALSWVSRDRAGVFVAGGLVSIGLSGLIAFPVLARG